MLRTSGGKTGNFSHSSLPASALLLGAGDLRPGSAAAQQATMPPFKMPAVQNGTLDQLENSLKNMGQEGASKGEHPNPLKGRVKQPVKIGKCSKLDPKSDTKWISHDLNYLPPNQAFAASKAPSPAPASTGLFSQSTPFAGYPYLQQLQPAIVKEQQQQQQHQQQQYQASAQAASQLGSMQNLPKISLPQAPPLSSLINGQAPSKAMTSPLTFSYPGMPNFSTGPLNPETASPMGSFQSSFPQQAQQAQPSQPQIPSASIGQQAMPNQYKDMRISELFHMKQEEQSSIVKQLLNLVDINHQRTEKLTEDLKFEMREELSLPTFTPTQLLSQPTSSYQSTAPTTEPYGQTQDQTAPDQTVMSMTQQQQLTPSQSTLQPQSENLDLFSNFGPQHSFVPNFPPLEEQQAIKEATSKPMPSASSEKPKGNEYDRFLKQQLEQLDEPREVVKKDTSSSSFPVLQTKKTSKKVAQVEKKLNEILSKQVASNPSSQDIIQEENSGGHNQAGKLPEVMTKAQLLNRMNDAHTNLATHRAMIRKAINREIRALHRQPFQNHYNNLKTEMTKKDIQSIHNSKYEGMKQEVISDDDIPPDTEAASILKSDYILTEDQQFEIEKELEFKKEGISGEELWELLRMAKIQRASEKDDELDKYMRKKYLRGEIAGLVGKVHDKANMQPRQGVPSSVNELQPQNEAPNVCPTCGLQFTNKQSLRRHIMIKRKKCITKTLVDNQVEVKVEEVPACHVQGAGHEESRRMNRYHAQARHWDELIWGDQLIIHKDMSLTRINNQLAKMIGQMISMNFDPFDFKTVLQEEFEQFVLEKILFKMNRLLVSKILSQHYTVPFSEVTYLHSAHEEWSENFLEDLEDPRCFTRFNFEELRTRREAPDSKKNENIFLTPNFLQHFDFQGGYDEKVLHSKVIYAGFQAGIYIMDEAFENFQTLDKAEQIVLKEKRDHLEIIEANFKTFKCFHAIRLDPNSLYTYEEGVEFSPRDNESQMEKFRDSYAEMYSKYYDCAPCGFYLKFQREEPNNPISLYRLVEYDLSHSHPLGFHNIRFQDLVHFANPRYYSSDEFYYPHAHWRNSFSTHRFYGGTGLDEGEARRPPPIRRGGRRRGFKLANLKFDEDIILGDSGDENKKQSNLQLPVARRKRAYTRRRIRREEY